MYTKYLYALAGAALLLLPACSSKDQSTESMSYPLIQVTYPETKKVEQSDDYHGTLVNDPYRWLEIDTAAEVTAWVNEQNKATFGYLEQIPFRQAVKDRITELINYPRYSAPERAGDYYFFSKNDGLQNQAVIYYQKGLEGKPEVFIDPNTLSKDGTTAVSLVGFSKDKKYVTISRSDAGSDWQEFRVMEVATRRELPDRLRWVKFSGAAWHGDGFFYSRYPEPAKGTELSGNNQHHAVWYHRLGDDQSKDQLVYRDDKNPNGDIEIVCTGLRPGEKLYEELLIDADSYPTSHPLIYRASESYFLPDQLWPQLKLLEDALLSLDWDLTRRIIHSLVPEWQSH